MSDKLLIILHGEIKTPPLSQNARIQARFLLRKAFCLVCQILAQCRALASDVMNFGLEMPQKIRFGELFTALMSMQF